MAERLRQDKDFEKILIKLSGDIGIVEYTSKRKLTYVEAAKEYYESACIGTHECEKFDHDCWKCILSHFNPDELYEPLATHFKNAIEYTQNLIFGSNNNINNESHYDNNDKNKSLVKRKSEIR